MFERGFSGGGGDVYVPDEGIYILRFTGIDGQKEWPSDEVNDDGTPKPPDVSLFLAFEIEDPYEEYEGAHGKTVKFWFPARFTPGNKTGRLFAAMFGGELPAAFAGDEDELIGRKVRAMLKKGDNGYLRLAEALPIKKKAEAAGQVPF